MFNIDILDVYAVRAGPLVISCSFPKYWKFPKIKPILTWFLHRSGKSEVHFVFVSPEKYQPIGRILDGLESLAQCNRLPCL